MSESEIEGFINKVESGLVEAQHDMLVEKALYNRPVVISDGNGGVVEVSAKQLLNQKSFYHSFNSSRPSPFALPFGQRFSIPLRTGGVGSGRAAWFCLRSASSLSFGRGYKAAESGDVDYEYHHIIKGLYATFYSWHIDPCRFP